jgi:hypothetical protein
MSIEGVLNECHHSHEGYFLLKEIYEASLSSFSPSLSSFLFSLMTEQTIEQNAIIQPAVRYFLNTPDTPAPFLKRKECWKYFLWGSGYVKGSKLYPVKCRLCGKEYKATSTRMMGHVTGMSGGNYLSPCSYASPSYKAATTKTTKKAKYTSSSSSSVTTPLISFSSSSSSSSFVTTTTSTTPTTMNNVPLPPPKLSKCLSNIAEVTPDGNCGFRVLSMAIYMNQDLWHLVRGQLLAFAHSKPAVLSQILDGDAQKETFDRLIHFDGRTDDVNKWFKSPECSFCAACRYNRIIIVLNESSIYDCTTFLPIETPPDPNSKPIVLVQVNGNHYRLGFLAQEPAFPPISTYWKLYRGDKNKVEWTAYVAPMLARWNESFRVNTSGSQIVFDVVN